jgi:hypothetical protein
MEKRVTEIERGWGVRMEKFGRRREIGGGRTENRSGRREVGE